jgi:hypothetical protein
MSVCSDSRCRSVSDSFPEPEGCAERQLNYMLIGSDVRRCYKEGKLFAARPIASWAGEPRAFFMCRPIYDAIQAGRQNEDEKERQRWARLEAQMGTFVEGGYVNDDFVKQLLPQKYEHWELKSRRPKPSLRVFGRFAEPDVFVGTHVLPRNGLGGMWSPEFEHEKLVCEDHWKDAGLTGFFTDPPGFRYEQYITSNASKKVRISR